MNEEPVNDFQDDGYEWLEEVAILLDEIDAFVPELLDRRLPKAVHERLRKMLLDARELKENNQIWLH